MTNTSDRFAIIPVAPGPTPHNAIMTGPLDLIMQNLPDTHSRQDAIEQLEFARIKSDQISTMQNVSRALQVSAFCDSIKHLSARMDALATRRAERARKDAEEAKRQEAQRIQDYLASLPDPDEPHTPGEDPALIEDEDPDPFEPSELHTLPASNPRHEQQLRDVEHDADAGGIPLSYKNVPTSFVKSENEGDLPNKLTKELPPLTGTDPQFPEAREPTARNPAGISW